MDLAFALTATSTKCPADTKGRFDLQKKYAHEAGSWAQVGELVIWGIHDPDAPASRCISAFGKTVRPVHAKRVSAFARILFEDRKGGTSKRKRGRPSSVKGRMNRQRTKFIHVDTVLISAPNMQLQFAVSA